MGQHLIPGRGRQTQTERDRGAEIDRDIQKERCTEFGGRKRDSQTETRTKDRDTGCNRERETYRQTDKQSNK